jgi:hypothetical protein
VISAAHYRATWPRVSASIALLCLPAILATSQPGAAYSQAGSRTFPETGKTVTGAFLAYWESNGGLAQQGYPISGEMAEVSDLDGRSYTVQYFERAVFESHPEKQAPYNVLLSQLGTFQYRKKYPQGAPAQRPNDSPGSRLFAETGKRVGGKFLDYWQKNGGLPQQGYPISEEFTEKSDLDGRSYTVQYFERAVFEMHPENPPPYDVLLSQLGTFRYREKYPPGQGSGATPTALPGAGANVTGTWTQARPMLTHRSEHGAAVLGGKIYVVGGFSGPDRNYTGVSREVEVYDPGADAWSKVAPIPDALHHAAVSASDSLLYVTGGYMTSDDPRAGSAWVEVKTTWVYDPRSDKWSRAADMPQPRAAHASAFVNGKLYVIGGLAASVSTGLHVYDPATGAWNTSLPPMPQVREHLSAVGLDGKLYVIGGRNGRNLTLLEAFDPATNAWERLESMPVGRSGFTAVALDGRIHVFGGESLPAGQVVPGHDIYDPRSNTWVQQTPPIITRHGLTSVVLAGRWYILGGGTSASGGTFQTLSNLVDVFTPNK